MAGKQIILTMTELGGVELGIDAARVAEVVPPGEIDEDEVDLAALLGVGAPSARARRLVRLRGSSGDLSVRVGERVDMRQVDLRCLHRLPQFVRGSTRLTGVLGVIEGESGLGLLLDVDELSRVSSGAGRGG